MTMRAIISTIFLAVAILCNAQSSISESADKAYSEGNFTEAIELYKQSIEADGVSSAIYYNLGNAYYKADSMARAVIAYERSLKLDPTNDNARENLEFVRTKLVDAQGESTSYSTLFIEKTMRMLTGNGWAITSLVLFAILLSLAGTYALSNNEKMRKICFFSGIAAMFLTAASIVVTIMVTREQTANNEAVITAETSQLSTTPATPLNNSQQAFVLHEGTKVEVLDSVSTPMDPSSPMWYDVKVGSDHRAWVSKRDIEFI